MKMRTFVHRGGTYMVLGQPKGNTNILCVK